MAVPSVARQVLFEDVSRCGQPVYTPPFRPFGLSTRNCFEGATIKGEKPTKVSVPITFYFMFTN